MTDNELKEHCLQNAGIDLGRYSYNELNLIKDALRRYHNAKLKLLSISDVVGQSELLVCPDCKLPFTKEELQIKEHCFNCGWEFAN